MTKYFLTAALVTAIALPASAQNTSTTSAGDVAPRTAAKVEVKVNESLASAARINGDSAFAIARANAENGEVSSGELEVKDGRLVYQVHLLNKNKGASTVWVDAMSGEVLEATEHGGLKAILMHHKENKKLLDAKRDSVTKTP